VYMPNAIFTFPNSSLSLSAKRRHHCCELQSVPFGEVSLVVGLALNLGDYPLSFSAATLLVGSSAWPVKSPAK